MKDNAQHHDAQRTLSPLALLHVKPDRRPLMHLAWCNIG
jgi:hypothetical protein